MAYEGPQLTIPGLVAGADLSTKQFYFMKRSAAGAVVVCAAVTDAPVGVLQNTPLQGQPAVVCAIGVTKVVASADLAFSDKIGTANDGRAAAYTAADTTKYIVGDVIVDNAAAGGLVTALVNCAGARTLA